MLPIDIPLGTTVESLVTDAIPALHARLVSPGGPADTFTVTLRIEGRGSWTVRIQGQTMRVEEGEEKRPTLWMYTTEHMAEHFLRDALGPKRLMPALPRAAPPGAVMTMTDPRVIRRVAMASGRIEIAVIDEEGERLAAVFGLGDATRRPIDPDDPDTTVEVPVAALHGVLTGERGPEEALANGDVTVRGRRLLAMQLALAVAPFYPKRT